MSPNSLCGTALCIAFTILSGRIEAQSISQREIDAFPSKPIRFVVPFPPGGSNNALARMFAQKMGGHWGQQIIVDNRPAASSIIGSEITARASADGYTILMVGQGYFLNPSLYKTLPYDTIKDFARISMLVSTPSMLAAHPSVKANTTKELLAIGRVSPGKLNYASPSIGSNGHLSMELLSYMAGVKFIHIPYKGGGDALTALLSGEVHLIFTAPSSVIQHIKSDRLRAIGVSSTKRISSMPDVPAIAETIPGYEVLNAHGVLAPGKTPKPIINKLHAEFMRILQLSDMKERMAGLGLDPVGSSPDEFTTTTIENIKRFSKVLANAGIKAE